MIISDGNENRGNALEQALAAKDLGVQIDVLPVEYFYDKEVLVEKVSLPSDVKKGETVNINVVVRASEPTSGTLQVFQKDSDNRSVPAPGNEKPVPVELRRGVNVFTLKQLINEPSFYTFTAEFVPEKGSGDRRAINNVGHRVHLRPGHGPGALDRRGRAASTPNWSRRSAKEARGQGPDRSRESTAAGNEGGDPCPTTSASSSRSIP